MKSYRWTWAVAATGLVLAAFGAQAQTYPTKAVTIVAPFAAGGSADAIARLLAKELGQVLGQPVVVDNKPGAGGATGLIVVAKANPDGHTIGMGATGAVVIGPHLADAPPLNPDKQLQPLAKIADIPLVVATGAGSGYNSLSSLMTKARSSEVAIGNSGQNTAHHLAGELLAKSAKMRLIAVPYRGSAPAVNDLLGGQVPVAIVDLTSVSAHLQAGTIKALGVTSASRTRLAPDVPTIAEGGVPGYEAPAWMGLFGPKGMPSGVTQRLERELQTIMAKPEVQQQILTLAAEPAYLGSAQFTTFIDNESKRWAGVINGLPVPKK